MSNASPWLAAVAVVSGMCLQGAELKEGIQAPAFSALDQSGATVKLSDYRGKSTVVLYFYPKDGTPGCTAEACSFRDGLSAILATGAVILGVSVDDVKSHEAFAEKFHLPFPILADPDRKIIEAYGVRIPGLDIARRTTFIIDKQGIIRHIIPSVSPQNHDKQVLGLLQAMP